MVMKAGSWCVSSESDPRWNGDGESPCVGGFSIPQEAKEHIEKMKKELKSDPPDDLEWSYFKN